MARIGEKTIEEAMDQVEGLTRDWIVNLNDAFKKFGGKKFPVTYKVIFDVGKAGTNMVQTEIKFRPEPDISDTATGSADEEDMMFSQDEMKGKGSKVVPIRDRRGPVGRGPRYVGLGG